MNQAAIVENKRRASCALCFDSGMARGATDAVIVIASADDGFILPRGFDQRHLAIRRYRIATDRSRVNLRRSPHYKALRLLCFLVAGEGAATISFLAAKSNKFNSLVAIGVRI